MTFRPVAKKTTTVKRPTRALKPIRALSQVSSRRRQGRDSKAHCRRTRRTVEQFRYQLDGSDSRGGCDKLSRSARTRPGTQRSRPLIQSRVRPGAPHLMVMGTTSRTLKPDCNLPHASPTNGYRNLLGRHRLARRGNRMDQGCDPHPRPGISCIVSIISYRAWSSPDQFQVASMMEWIAEVASR